ncbi:MAG TPA: hypothetical protein VFA18_13150 [Gemmataceae bacterium]|nr:hypothetical protein [Gemmataceae bacterium]
MQVAILGALAGAVVGGLFGLGSFYATWHALDFWNVIVPNNLSHTVITAEDLPAVWLSGYAFSCTVMGVGIGGIIGAILGSVRAILKTLDKIQRRLPPLPTDLRQAPQPSAVPSQGGP